jgi:hypothetical protein
MFPFSSGEEPPGVVLFVGKCDEGRAIHSFAFLLVHFYATGPRLMRGD